MPDLDLVVAALAGAVVAARLMVVLRRTQRAGAVANAGLDERSRLLDRSEARHRSLVEQIPAVIVRFSLDEQPPRPVYVSPQTEAILGVPVDEWLSGPEVLDPRIHPDDRAATWAALEHAAVEGETLPVEFRFTRPDGVEIWLRDSGGVVVDDGGARFLQGMLFDVTAAKHAEADRDRMEHELRLSQKLEAIGQLAAGIAHEINTPVQFVGDTLRFVADAFDDLTRLADVQRQLRVAVEAGLPASELLDACRAAEEEADLDYLLERLPGAFERGFDGVARVASIVGAMRAFGHPPRAEKAPVDINEALGNTLIVSTNEHKYVADVVTDLAPLPPLLGYEHDLNQVFLNLVVNAAQAIADRLGDGDARGTITIRTRLDRGAVLVSVTDTGGGIPASVASRVFDPFFTTKEIGRGTGQGLAIARNIVTERHDGTIVFDSEPGVGTTFHVRLPVIVAAEALAA